MTSIHLADRTRRPGALRVAAMLIVMALVAAACGGEEAVETTTTAAVALTTIAETPDTVAPTTAAPTTTTTAAPEPTGPPSLLNGLPTAVDADLDRRVVAIKIDNHPDARPQSGPESADAMIELPVEAGITRFIALFHESDSEYIGPVRSGRPTDPTLIRPLGAVFQISGAQPWVQSIIRNFGVRFLGETRPNTFRIPRGNRAYERTLYANSEEIRIAADNAGYDDVPPPGSWFTFSDTPTELSEEATELAFNWSGDWPTVHWIYEDGRYLRFNGEQEHNWADADGNSEQISAEVLVVITARPYTASGSSGSAVPALDAVGEGVAYVFHNGMALEGTWERETVEEFFVLTTSDGDEITIPPGQLWVSYFPNTRNVTWE